MPLYSNGKRNPAREINQRNYELGKKYDYLQIFKWLPSILFQQIHTSLACHSQASPHSAHGDRNPADQSPEPPNSKRLFRFHLVFSRSRMQPRGVDPSSPPCRCLVYLPKRAVIAFWGVVFFLEDHTMGKNSDVGTAWILVVEVIGRF